MRASAPLLITTSLRTSSSTIILPPRWRRHASFMRMWSRARPARPPAAGEELAPGHLGDEARASRGSLPGWAPPAPDQPCGMNQRAVASEHEDQLGLGGSSRSSGTAGQPVAPRGRARPAARGPGSGRGPRGRAPPPRGFPSSRPGDVFTLGGKSSCTTRAYADRDGPVRPRRREADRRARAARRADAPRLARGVRGPGAPAPARAASCAARSRRTGALAHPLGAARHRQDHAGPGHRGAPPGRLRPASAVLVRGEGHPRGGRRRPRSAGGCTGQRTMLFVDEIHRFNKAQQDAFLPHVETGHRHPDRRHHREPLASRSTRRSSRAAGW